MPTFTTETGSATVEFTVLATVLLIPTIYLLVFIGYVQSGGYASVALADQTARIIASAPDDNTADYRTQQAITLTAQDFGFDPQRVTLSTRCSNDPCQTPGTMISTDITISVGLPFIPNLLGVQTSLVELNASSHLKVGEFE